MENIQNEVHARIYVAKAEEMNIRKLLFYTCINRDYGVRIQGVHLISLQILKVPNVREK